MSGLLQTPDSPLVTRLSPSPNFGERRGGGGIDMIVLHYTGCPSAESAELWMCSPESQVSAHYLVEEDGAIVQLVAEGARAWHAGAAHWAGEDDVNSRSIGIEIQNEGHACGAPPPYPEAQLAAVEALVADIARRRGIAPERVVGHSDVAPARKADPGEHFPWARLAAAGLALPVPAAPAGGETLLRRGDTGEAVREVQWMLARIGYGVPATGAYCAQTEAVVRAFQRRFRPAGVSGTFDAGTQAALEAVLAMLDARGARA
jgi:N-acetylmuramoyl-L-alanine amidase